MFGLMFNVAVLVAGGFRFLVWSVNCVVALVSVRAGLVVIGFHDTLRNNVILG